MKITRNHITKRYNDMLKKYTPEKLQEFEKGVKTHAYECVKGHRIMTIDINPGTTPVLIKCQQCNNFATSQGYHKTKEEPKIEWYRPTLKEVLKQISKGRWAMADHVLNGGLEKRKRTQA